MSDWSNLPTEVLIITLYYIKAIDKNNKQNNVSQCTLTCRSWRTPAQAVLFSEITIASASNIDSLTRIALENNKLKKWVKSLNYSKTGICTTTALVAADASFPSLETLDFCGNNLLYSSFCKMLIENGKFKNLTKLPMSVNKEQDIMYNQCLDLLQGRITSITLTDDHVNNRNIYQDVIDSLDRFPRLEKVFIRTTITTDMRYQNLVKYINPLIANNLVPSLKELCITSSVNNSYCFRLSTQGQESLLPMAELKSLTVNMCNEKCITISEDFMLFIMNQCPNLDSIHVKISGTSFTCQRTFRYQQTLLNFMIYLLKMPNFSLQNSVMITKEATQLIEDYYTAIEKESNLLKLSRALFITDDPRGSAGDSFGVIAFKNDYSMRLQSVDFQLFRAKSTPANKVDEEQIQLVEKIGRFFNTVSLQITSSDYLATLFKCVARIQCERLKTLIIEGPSTSIYKESFLQDKEIVHCYSVKELVLSKCCLSQEQLLYTSIVLPRLEKLVLKNFLGHKSLLPSKASFFICLPNWSLKYLEIEMNSHFSFKKSEELLYHIKLTTDDPRQNPRHCFFKLKINSTLSFVSCSLLIDNPIEATFQHSVSSPHIISYHIYCRSVEKFTFKYIDTETKHHKTLDIVGEPVKE